MLGAGTILDGRFRIEEIIGRGGMGAVYKATETHNNKAVAIKELLVHIENPSERDNAFKQFKRESEMLVKLKHNGIPEMMGYFLQGENAYLAMEFVEGITMEALVCENEELPTEAQAVDWAMQLCEVLEFLHELQPPIIFRDLKPSNVMISTQGQVKLIDFGIAKTFDPVYQQTASYLRGSGTPGYAPMEQYGKGSTDPRSDVYSLGATVYFVLTGRDPPQSVDIASGVDVLVPPRAYNPEISPALEETILKMMAIRKEDRYQNATEAQDALRSVQNGGVQTLQRIPTKGGRPDRTATLEIMPGQTHDTGQWRRKVTTGAALKATQPPPRRSGALLVLSILLVAAALCGVGWVVLNPTLARCRLTVQVDNDADAVLAQKELAGYPVKVSKGQRVADVSRIYVAPANQQQLEKFGPVSPYTTSDGTKAFALNTRFATHNAAAAKAKEIEKKGIHVDVDDGSDQIQMIEIEAAIRERDKAEELKKRLLTHRFTVTLYEQ